MRKLKELVAEREKLNSQISTWESRDEEITQWLEHLQNYEAQCQIEYPELGKITNDKRTAISAWTRRLPSDLLSRAIYRIAEECSESAEFYALIQQAAFRLSELK